MYWWKGGELPEEFKVWRLHDEIKSYLEEHSKNADRKESVYSFLKDKFKFEEGSDKEKVYEWILSYWFS